jgi:hypothetical protein
MSISTTVLDGIVVSVSAKNMFHSMRDHHNHLPTAVNLKTYEED